MWLCACESRPQACGSVEVRGLYRGGALPSGGDADRSTRVSGFDARADFSSASASPATSAFSAFSAAAAIAATIASLDGFPLFRKEAEEKEEEDVLVVAEDVVAGREPRLPIATGRAFRWLAGSEGCAGAILGSDPTERLRKCSASASFPWCKRARTWLVPRGDSRNALRHKSAVRARAPSRSGLLSPERLRPGHRRSQLASRHQTSRPHREQYRLCKVLLRKVEA